LTSRHFTILSLGASWSTYTSCQHLRDEWWQLPSGSKQSSASYRLTHDTLDEFYIARDGKRLAAAMTDF